jgi:hypothetical protein
LARLAAACNEAGQVMCDKCSELDRKIAHYRRLAFRISDKQTQDGIAELIKQVAAAKAAIRCDQPEAK